MVNSKWIRFSDISYQYPEFKTKVWQVITIALPNDVIGIVRWYGPWRQYCFVPAENTVYNAECLRDIAQFCQESRLIRQPAPDDVIGVTV